MKRYRGVGGLLALLALGATPLAFGVDPFYDSSPEMLPGAVSGEEAIDTIDEREDDQGVARDTPEQDMHGTGVDSSTPADVDSPYADLEPESSALDEPSQPIRPGQMEQEGDSSGWGDS